MAKSLITFFVAALLTGLPSQAQINLAGIYEGEMNDNITRKRMYLNIDFLNEVPDFTQIFTSKEAPLKILPKDFMNSKKLKKNFAGQQAPAFAKYNSKTLFSSTEELKLTNPILENGILTANWENNEGTKGKCFIIVYPDRSLQILGLTSLVPDLGPDNLKLTLVEDKLSASLAPYITPGELLPDIEKRYCREILWKIQVNKKNGIPRTAVSVNPDKIRRIGNNVLVPVVWNNKTPKAFNINFDANPFERNEYATVNGDVTCGVYTADGKTQMELEPDVNTAKLFEITNVPLNAQKIDMMKIVGRAPDSPRANEKNYYGDFHYIISNIVIPELKPSNRQGCFVSDGDIIIVVDTVMAREKDLVVNFRLMNDSKRDKNIYVQSGSVARTQAGDGFEVAVKLPESIEADAIVKGEIIVAGAAREILGTVRIPVKVGERQFEFPANIYLTDISVGQ